MKIMKSKSVTLFKDVLVTVFVILLLLDLSSLLRFRYIADGVMSKLSIQNQSVLADVSHPFGVSRLNSTNSIMKPENEPLYIVYDARSEIRYRTNNVSTGFIVDYYKKYFASQKWEQDWQIDDPKVNGRNSYGFHKGTACAALNFNPKDATLQLGIFSSYTITIRHDFWGQTFSPISPLGITKFLVSWRYSLPRCPTQIS